MLLYVVYEWCGGFGIIIWWDIFCLVIVIEVFNLGLSEEYKFLLRDLRLVMCYISELFFFFYTYILLRFFKSSYMIIIR